MIPRSTASRAAIAPRASCASRDSPKRGSQIPSGTSTDMYAVKEIFYTLQGEGIHTGRPAVFCRFAGCNLWSGHEADRVDAVCKFCDTDFVGIGPDGGKFVTAVALAERVAEAWPSENGPASQPYVVCTGGEPLLQVDEALTAAFHA